MDIAFTGTHTPHAGLSDSQKDAYWRRLTDIHKTHGSGNKAHFVLGDFNARIIEKSEDEHVIGPFYLSQTEVGLECLSLCGPLHLAWEPAPLILAWGSCPRAQRTQRHQVLCPGRPVLLHRQAYMAAGGVFTSTGPAHRRPLSWVAPCADVACSDGPKR